jgi:A/G-specific adenine glycosylase
MKELHAWFKENQRSFPWREERTPYRVWISEVMLQQTRASVVVPYFLRWIQQFPDVTALAAASLEEVIKAWEGLGYYSRARNLHKGARQIVAHFGGKIPDSKKELDMICGLGPYTIGAIMSFGFQKRAAAVDGNVARVMSRYFAMEENISRAKVRQSIERKMEALLDEKEPWITVEAFIELGATLCLPQPRCEGCPIQSSCQGFQKGIAASLPIKNIEKPVTALTRIVAIVEWDGQILVRKGEDGKVMADLYEFPYFEGNNPALLKNWLKMDIHSMRPLEQVTHTFTRYKAYLIPYLILPRAPPSQIQGIWIPRKQLLDLPFSAGHRKIAKRL